MFTFLYLAYLMSISLFAGLANNISQSSNLLKQTDLTNFISFLLAQSNLNFSAYKNFINSLLGNDFTA